jgi:hypothetical protein
VWQRLPLRAIIGAASLFSVVGGLTGCDPFSFMLCGVVKVRSSFLY